MFLTFYNIRRKVIHKFYTEKFKFFGVLKNAKEN